MKYFIIISNIIVLAFSSRSQKNIYLEITPMFLNSNLEMNVDYTAWNGKVFKLDHFDYYLSSVQLTFDGGQTVDIDSVFLIEPQSHTLLLGSYDINQIEKISFLIGVPKTLNTQSGSAAIDISLYQENHPLSFQSPSMYWGWQSGYMHMIMGGYADDNGDGTLESYFELHNLGNLNQQSVEIPNIVQTNIASNQINLNVNCQVDRWINNISINNVGVLHGEVGVNASMMNNVPLENVFIQSLNAQAELLNSKSNFYFFNKDDEMTINWTKLFGLYFLQVTDLNGKLIEKYYCNDQDGSLTLKNLESGYYLIKFCEKNGSIIENLNAVH
jgi:hypothetical protein